MQSILVTDEMVRVACSAYENQPGEREWTSEWKMRVALEAALAAAPQPEQEPVAWRTFDGEGGWDLRNYEDNETYRDEYIKRNGERYASWVEPLYTAHPARRDLKLRAAAVMALHEINSPMLADAGAELERWHRVTTALRAALDKN